MHTDGALMVCQVHTGSILAQASKKDERIKPIVVSILRPEPLQRAAGVRAIDLRHLEL